MSSFRLVHLLLLSLALAILGSSTTSAHRVLKGGCLNYGHSCLGAHGKRSSNTLGEVRSATPTLQPALPRPLLDILLDALSSATRPGSQSSAHPQFRQRTHPFRFPSDSNASPRGLLLEDVNEGGVRVLADGNEDSAPFAYAPNDQDAEDAVYVFSPVEDYSEARYRRDAGNAKGTISAKDETHTKESEREKKEKQDGLEVTRDDRMGGVDSRSAQPRRIVDLHILANWVRR